MRNESFYHRQKNYIRLVEEDELEEGPEWSVIVQLSDDTIDDDFDDENASEEVIINAPDIDTAIKYAQQYVRKMQKSEDTAEQWVDAEIISIRLR